MTDYTFNYPADDLNMLEITASVRLNPLHASIAHLMDHVERPLVSLQIDNQGPESRTLNISVIVDQYSDEASDTLEVPAGESRNADCRPVFDSDKIAEINELRNATVRVRIDDLANGLKVLEKTLPLQILAVNSAPLAALDPATGEFVDQTRFFGAMVTPNDPELDTFLERVARKLPEGRKFDGYRSDASEQVQKIYEALAMRGAHYVDSTLDFNPDARAQITQRVRLPKQTLISKLANCIDGVLLFASLLERIGLEPAIVILPRHAIVAWAVEAGSNDWQYLETTSISSMDRVSFEKAMEIGKRKAQVYEQKCQESGDKRYFRRWPLRDLRKQKIQPLPKVAPDNLGRIARSIEEKLNPGSEPQSIDPTVVRQYLEAVSKGPPAPYRLPHQADNDSEAKSRHKEKKRLWETPFHVHSAPDAQLKRLTLTQALGQSFSRDRELDRLQRAVILAQAGAGKTPALYSIRTEIAQENLEHWQNPTSSRAGDTAQNNLSNGPESIIPIYINLADIAYGAELSTLIRDEFNRNLLKINDQARLAVGQIPDLLKDYICLFLFDELDAIVEEHDAMQRVRQFMESNHNELYAIACRASNYRQQLGSLDEFILNDLSEEETRIVLTDDIYDQLYNSLGNLTHNRLLLRIALDLMEMKPWSGKVTNKGQLIEQLTKARLRLSLERITDTQNSRADRIFDVETTESLLEHISYHMMCDHAYGYDERELMLVIQEFLELWRENRNWRDVAAFLRDSKMLKRDAQRKWRLRDRTTAAYFTAAAMLHEQKLLELVLQECSDFWWREVLEIYIGLTPEPRDFIFEIMDIDVLIAAHCAQYRKLSKESTEALIDTLVERIQREDSTERARIATQLGESGHHRAGEALIRALHRESASSVIMAIVGSLWRWARKRNIDQLAELERIVIKDTPQQIESLVDFIVVYEQFALSQDNRDREKYVTRLIEYVNDGSNSKLARGICIIGLGYCYTSKARALLLDLMADKSIDSFLAWCATDALTRSDDPSIEAVTIKLFRNQDEDNASSAEPSRPLRARAVHLLGWISDSKEARDLLRGEALTDSDPSVRGYAVEAVVRLDLPGTRPIIEDMLNGEDDHTVIRKCAESLAKVGGYSSIPVLERHLYDINARTRWRVRSSLTEIRHRLGIETA